MEADALITRTASEQTAGLAAARADTRRLRLAVKGGRPFQIGGEATLTPSFELAVRHDGGDAETGSGVDLGGGLAYANPASGLTVEVRARGLVAHEAAGYREWGFSGSLGYDPDPSSERGLALSLTGAHGARAAGGADALFHRATMDGLAADTATMPGGRLDALLGYGLPAFGDRFTGTPWLGLGQTAMGRDIRIGCRLSPAGERAPNLQFGIEAGRRTGPEGADHSLALRLDARF